MNNDSAKLIAKLKKDMLRKCTNVYKLSFGTLAIQIKMVY